MSARQDTAQRTGDVIENGLEGLEGDKGVQGNVRPDQNEDAEVWSGSFQ